MYELKKIGKVFTRKFVGTGPSSYKKRIYWAAVSQRFTNTVLHVSNPTVQLQEDGCVYMYGTAYFTCTSISSRVCSVLRLYQYQYKHTVLATRLLIELHVKHSTIPVYTTVFLKMNPRVRNM
jgi:hypothetical protein